MRRRVDGRPPEVKRLQFFPNDAVLHLPGPDSGLDPNGKLVTEPVAALLKKLPGPLGSVQQMDGVAAVERQGVDGREGVAGKVGDEATRGVHQGHQRLEDIVEDDRKLLGPRDSLLHQGFGQGGEAAQVYVQREGLDPAP